MHSRYPDVTEPLYVNSYSKAQKYVRDDFILLLGDLDLGPNENNWDHSFVIKILHVKFYF